MIRHAPVVAGEHDGAADAAGMQALDGVRSRILDPVCDQEMPQVFSVHAHMDDGAHAGAQFTGDMQAFHELFIAHGDEVSVHSGRDALAGVFLCLRDSHRIRRPAPGTDQGLGNGVGGMAFAVCRILQERLPRNRGMVDFGHFEDALGHGAGLVKGYNIRLGKGFQVAGTLDQNAGPAGSADTGEEGQRDGDHKGAGAGDDQEGQGAHDPVQGVRSHPEQQTDQGHQHSQHHGQCAHGRGIDPGEAGNECLGAALETGCVFHHLKNPGGSGGFEFLRSPDAERAGLIDGARQHRVAGTDCPWHAFPGEGRGIQRRGAFLHHTVQRDFFAGGYLDQAADLHFIRVHTDGGLVFLQEIGVVRTDIHELGDIPAASADGHGLEKLADLVEQHDGGAFRVVPGAHSSQDDGTQGGESHEKVLIKRLTVPDALEGLDQNIVSDHKVGNQVKKEFHPPVQESVQGKEMQDDHQNGGDQDAGEDAFLFFRQLAQHGRRFLSEISEIDFTFVFHFPAVLQHPGHDFLGIRLLVKVNNHFQGHEIDGAVTDPRRLFACLFHFRGTVCTVDLNGICLLHNRSLRVFHLNI